MMQPDILDHTGDSCGAQVPLKGKEQAHDIISQILLPDAIKTLSLRFPSQMRDRKELIIEIRGKVCTYHPYFSKVHSHYGTPCPDDHKGLSCCAIAWVYFFSHGNESNIPDELPTDFNARFRPAGGQLFYPVTRIKIELGR